MKSYLEFERDIKGLEEEIEKLKDPIVRLQDNIFSSQALAAEKLAKEI